ncbi:MAG: hypothetical protein GY771_14255 [bacterium]|nr:hypothetical protein [bacterium]
MNTKLYLILALALVVSFAFIGCTPKDEGDDTGEDTGEVTGEDTVTPDIVETDTPDAAGSEAVTPTADTAKTQVLEGLQFAYTMVGWNNEVTVGVLGVVIGGLEIAAEASDDEAEKGAIAQAKQDLLGAKGNLETALAGAELSKEDLDAVKSTVKGAYNTLKAIWMPAGGGTLAEDVGDKLKEGHKLEGDKIKEGHKEEGDKLKEKYAEGEAEGK